MKKNEKETAKREDREEEEEWAMTDFWEEKATGFVFFSSALFLKIFYTNQLFFQTKIDDEIFCFFEL